MMATTTVNTRTTVIKGKATLVTHAPVSTVLPGTAYSLHDCDDPSKAELWNCVWPINLASKDGVTFNNGITVHHASGTRNTVSVTTA